MHRPSEIQDSGGMMSLIPKFDIDAMNLAELKEVVKMLVRLANIDADLIRTLQERVLTLELKHGE
jgi:hypothetical protein